MEAQSSSPRSQQPATEPNPEPDESSPQTPSYIFKVHFGHFRKIPAMRLLHLLHPPFFTHKKSRKFGVDVIPQKPIPNAYILISYSW
jgi:hypothetical protein